MPHYMSMQMVRFRSTNDYERFQMLWREAMKALMSIDGFVSVTWWVHPEDPTLFLETSIWEDLESTNNWHMDGLHKKLKEWGVDGPIMEDTVTNWTEENAKILRVCPLCRKGISRSFSLDRELADKAIPCDCRFAFPYLESTGMFAVYKHGADAGPSTGSSKKSRSATP